MNKDKLTLALFGGSGATGQQIIAQAVQQGILIRGLVRESSSLGEHGEYVVQITGSLDDPDALDQALEGANAVSIVFGPKPPYKDIFCAAATESILRAMHRAGIQRVICQTGAMIGTYPRKRTLLFDLMARFYRRTVPS